MLPFGSQLMLEDYISHFSINLAVKCIQKICVYCDRELYKIILVFGLELFIAHIKGSYCPASQ